MTKPYAAHPSFVALARPVVALKYVGLGVLAYELTFYLTPYILAMAGLPAALLAQFYQADTPFGMGILLTSFALPVAALALVVVNLHRRAFLSLIGPLGLAFWQFRRVVLYVGGVLLVLLVLSLQIDPETVSRIRPFGGWLALMPVAILAVLIQTGAEELFFRGYLQQQLGALSTNPLVWMVLPSLAFGLSHYWNASTTADAIYYMGWTFVFGCCAADLTARAGTLGPAMAVHLLNNFFQMAFFGLDGAPMSGFALVLFEWDGTPITYLVEGAPWVNGVLVLLSLVMLLVLWLAARLAIRR